MKLYTCSYCESPLYFENNICLTCQQSVGFEAQNSAFITLKMNNEYELYDIKHPENKYSYCKNAVQGTCNWLIPAGNHSDFCQACELNRMIPNLFDPKNANSWKRIEIAKHRLIYSLLRLNLPVKPKKGNETEGIVFDFMSDPSSEERVMTGHAGGLITLNIEEADELERTRHKIELGENYRTLLGHFRHEIGHYYWEILIQNTSLLEEFRQLFGDEREDYAQALKNYYQTTPPADWIDNYISIYATSHPWEDWAETWSHYLHLMDTLETAFSFGIRIKPEVTEEQDMHAKISQDPYLIPDFDRIVKMWLPLTFALNSLNRSMGHPDFYPFVISKPVIEKLHFIHKVCGTRRN